MSQLKWVYDTSGLTEEELKYLTGNTITMSLMDVLNKDAIARGTTREAVIEDILKLLADDSPIWDDPRGVQKALIETLKGENK